jgi:hypothetical protein
MERRAGQHLGERRKQLARQGLAICAAALTALAVAWKLEAAWWLFTLICGASVVAIRVAEADLLPRMDRLRRGEQGERVVGELLESLAPDGWRVLHDISFGRGNIDHILIGPGGVLTVETKSHAGRLQADRIDPKMLSQAYAQRKLLERITQREVDALLVFSRAYLEPAISRRKGVLVLPARLLRSHLARRGAVLTEREVERTHALLRQALAT